MKYDPPPGVTIVEYEKSIRSLTHLLNKYVVDFVAKMQETRTMSTTLKKLSPKSKFKVDGKGIYFNDT